jgi:ABC-type uncharacterized transport system substrate-binding protein
MLVASLATTPITAYAQGSQCKSAPANVPVIGFLSSVSPETMQASVAAFRQGLKDTGYVENINAVIEYRWANGNNPGVLSNLATQLINCKVAVIVTSGGTPPAEAAKKATTTIPIVFGTGFDPVRTGLVPSYDRPNMNITGVAMQTAAGVAARRELLAKLSPRIDRVGLLVNPTPALAKERVDLGKDLGGDDRILEASNDNELRDKFEEAAKARGYNGMIVSANPFYGTRRSQIVQLAANNNLPTIYPWSEYVDAGGLISYGVSLPNTYRDLGLYAGKILNGAKPANLPILTSQLEIAINLITARALGLTVPLELVKRASYVIGS